MFKPNNRKIFLFWLQNHTGPFEKYTPGFHINSCNKQYVLKLGSRTYSQLRFADSCLRPKRSMNRFVFVAVALILVAGPVVQGRSAHQPSPHPVANNYYPPQGNNYNRRPYDPDKQLDTCERQKVLLIAELQKCKHLAIEEAEPLASEEADMVNRLEQIKKKQLVAELEKLLEKLRMETA